MTGYAPPPPPRLRTPAKSGRGLLAVRVLRPPVPLEVILENRAGSSPAPTTANSRPMSLQSPPDAAPPISGAVRIASGPWSLEDGWWTDVPANRDYWDVELADGGLYRIYRDRAGSSWFADGIYD